MQQSDCCRQPKCQRIMFISAFILFIQLPGCYTHNLLTMKTEQQVYVFSLGEAFALDCKFQAVAGYNLFDFPVLWRKSQLGEETQMNVMGNVNEPFLSTNRFEVAFTQTIPIFNLLLTITDAQHEDSGNYTCEIRGPQSIIIGKVTHLVYIKDVVQRVVLSEDTRIDSLTESPPAIHLVESRPSTLGCVAFGGYPPPTLDIHIGRNIVTQLFHFSQNATFLNGGRRGLRHVVYRTDRWSFNFLPQAADDQLQLKCVATPVAVLQSRIESVLLSINYMPKINCTSVEASVGDRKVAVRCDVKARPRVKGLLWIIDTNGTMLTSTDTVSDYWFTTSDRQDVVVEVTLFIRQMLPHMFHKYTLVAENTVGINSVDVEVVKYVRPTKTPVMTRVPSKQSNNRAGSSTYVRRSEVSSHQPSVRERYVTTTRRSAHVRSHAVTLHRLTASFSLSLIVLTVANIATGYFLTNVGSAL